MRTHYKFVIYEMTIGFPTVLVLEGAVIAQLVQRLATGLTTEGSDFESRYDQEFSLVHVVQTGSGVHLASYTMGTGGSFSGGKAAGA
jgi:hypothetical protein